ncbi:MAG: hypothetical protein AMXMBFR64_02580 [Myxococcales bacterium]
MRGPVRRALVRVALVALVVVAAMAARALVESHAALDAGRAALLRGDHPAALFHLRSAGRWVTPGNPWAADAVAELMALGAAAEQREDWLLALEAYDAVRAASLGARSFYTPHAAALAAANERLPAVLARAREVHPTGPRSSSEDRPALEARFREDVARDRSPKPVPATVAVLCFAAWIAAMATGVWRSVPGDGPVRRATALRWAAASAALFAAWLALLAAS